MLMKTHAKTVLTTKSINQVPFKSELYSKDVSGELLHAAGNKKTYRQFIRDCDDPKLLHEILIIKRNQENFPGIKKIQRIAFYAAFAATVTAFFKGKKLAVLASCYVYRNFLPKKQYSNEL